MTAKDSLSDYLAGGIYYAILLEAFLIALSPPLATAALLLGVIFWLARLVVDKECRRFRRLPYDVPAALFALLGAVSIFASPDRGFSFYNYYNLVGVYLLTYLLVGQNVRASQDIRKIVYALGLSCVLVLLYGFYQFAFGIDTSTMKWVDGDAFPELKKRVFSTWENPNILAGYLDVAMCFAFAFFVKMRDKKRRIALGAALVLLAACLAMTYARMAFLVIALIFILYGMFRDGRVLLAVGVVAGALFLLDPALLDRVMSVFTRIDTSSEMRLALWESTLAMIGDHPFFGIGWGAYWMVYPEYDFYLQGADVLIVHAHNMYLNYAAEIGVVGAVSFLWFFFGTMGLAFFSKVHDSEGFRQGLMLAISLAFISVALNGLTDDVLFNIPSSMLLWLLAALAAVTEFAGNEDDEAVVMDELAARKRQKLRELRQRAKKGGESPKNSGEESEN